MKRIFSLGRKTTLIYLYTKRVVFGLTHLCPVIVFRERHARGDTRLCREQVTFKNYLRDQRTKRLGE